jgi:hypothetical protein
MRCGLGAFRFLNQLTGQSEGGSRFSRAIALLSSCSVNPQRVVRLAGADNPIDRRPETVALGIALLIAKKRQTFTPVSKLAILPEGSVSPDSCC